MRSKRQVMLNVNKTFIHIFTLLGILFQFSDDELQSATAKWQRHYSSKIYLQLFLSLIKQHKP